MQWPLTLTTVLRREDFLTVAERFGLVLSPEELDAWMEQEAADLLAWERSHFVAEVVHRLERRAGYREKQRRQVEKVRRFTTNYGAAGGHVMPGD